MARYGVANCKVILAACKRVLADGVLLIGSWHSAGARLVEDVMSLHTVSEVFTIMVRTSGAILRSRQ